MQAIHAAFRAAAAPSPFQRKPKASVQSKPAIQPQSAASQTFAGNPALLRAYYGVAAAPARRPMAPVVPLHFGLRPTAPGDSPEQWPYGAHVAGNKARFKLWAPAVQGGKVELLLIDAEKKDLPPHQRVLESIEMKADGEHGIWFYTEKRLPPHHKPLLYMYRLRYPDGGVSKPLPDPRSRYQPEDIHGPSEVVPDNPFPWAANTPERVTDKRQMVTYKLHIGTFTKEGSLQAAIQKLPYLKALGFTNVELMPIQEFPGKRNWGYDMAGFFAVENAYGRPEDLKRFIDEAHKEGLNVNLDVVYNHIGPEGNYLGLFDRGFTDNSPGRRWGSGFNWANPFARQFVKDNLTMWMNEFNVDGFRFDFTQDIPDEVSRDLTEHIHKQKPGLYITAEDGRCENHITNSREAGGLGYPTKWNFEFHHRLMAVIAPDISEQRSLKDRLQMLLWLMEEGHPGPGNRANSLHNLVNFIQSHDEVGNHDGERLPRKVNSRSEALLASLLKYTHPSVPMNLMGEEYAETSPFYYPVDHSDPEIIRKTREGRSAANQPDCMDPNTFLQSKLSWEKDEGYLRATQDMLRLRREIPALWQGDQHQMKIDHTYVDSGVGVMHRWGRENPEDEVLVIFNVSNDDYKKNYWMRFPVGKWQEVFNSDDSKYGGQGLTNASTLVQGNQNINLPGKSLLIFRKKHG